MKVGVSYLFIRIFLFIEIQFKGQHRPLRIGLIYKEIYINDRRIFYSLDVRSIAF